MKLKENADERPFLDVLSTRMVYSKKHILSFAHNDN